MKEKKIDSKLRFILLFLPLLAANYSALNLGLAADDFWRLPMVNSITLQNLIWTSVNWIPGRNLQIIWVKILTYIFGIDITDVWKYNIFGLFLSGILITLFFNLLLKLKINRPISVICTLIFAFWPTHSETSFWIEQTIQVQLPLIFILLWIILTLSIESIKKIYFILSDLILIFCILFTYDQAAFVISFLVIVRLIYFLYLKNFNFIKSNLIPSLIIVIFWILVITGNRRGGPELKPIDNFMIEYFVSLWHHSIEINTRIISPRFQPYAFFGYWPWSVLIVIIFVFITFFIFFITLKLSKSEMINIYKSIPYYKYKNITISSFYIFLLMTSIVFLYVSYLKAKLFDVQYIYPRSYIVIFGVLLFVFLNLFVDIKAKNDISHKNYIFIRIFLILCFYVSYFPNYIWSISPRHNLIPSLFVCLSIATLLNQLFRNFYLKEKNHLIIILIFSFFISTLIINFHFSARAYSQSWLLKKQLYSDLYSSINLKNYTVDKSCWIIENEPKEFMGFPLFVYESPQTGFNYVYKLPPVNFCDKSKNIKNFTKLHLIFDPNKSFFKKFNYTLRIS